MFKIARQQMTQLAETSARQFEARMLERLNERLPIAVIGMNREQLLDKVKQGVVRAAIHHITSEKDVARFITVATALGEHFEVDPKIREILDMARPGAPTDVVDKLVEQAAHKVASKLGLPPPATDPAAISAPATPAGDDEFSATAEVGDPVAPCPKSSSRRLYSFSS